MANSKISALTSATTPLAGTETLPVVQSSTTKQVSVANLTAGRSVAVGTLNSSGDITLSGAVGRVVSSANNQRVLVTGGSSAGTTTGAYIILEGYDYGGAGAGGAINLVSTSGTTAPISLSPAGTAQITATTTGVAIPVQNITFSTAAKGINFTANTPASGMTSQLLNWYEEGTWTPVLSGSSTAGTYQLATASGWYTRVGRSITVIFNVKLAAVVTGGGTGFAVLSGLPFNTATTNAAAGAVTLGSVNYTVTTNYVTVMPRSVGSASLIFEEVNINGAVNDMSISAFGTNDTIQGTLTYLV
jgi:hypothetical protein